MDDRRRVLCASRGTRNARRRNRRGRPRPHLVHVRHHRPVQGGAHLTTGVWSALWTAPTTTPPKRCRPPSWPWASTQPPCPATRQIVLNTSPLFHVSGLMAGIFMHAADGNTIVFREGRFDPADVLPPHRGRTHHYLDSHREHGASGHGTPRHANTRHELAHPDELRWRTSVSASAEQDQGTLPPSRCIHRQRLWLQRVRRGDHLGRRPSIGGQSV